MKNLFILLLTMVSLSAFAQEKGANDALNLVSGPGATIDFVTETLDYGTIEHNADGIRFFEFKNNGTEPLIITNCKGSCGCTVPSHPKEPILPGETGKIQVKYATNRVGAFTKTITVTSNAVVPSKVIKIKGKVLPAVVETPVKQTESAAPSNN